MNLLAQMNVSTDMVWILCAGALVFFMQAGFLCLEVGAVRPKAANITALKNLIDWLICTLFFFFFGWGIMFGHSASFGLFGKDGFMLGYPESMLNSGLPIGPYVHFVFELAFAGTAATIVSGALAERASFYAYMVFSMVVSALIYPVVGHWIWGGSFFASNETHALLAKHGFIDFAGSTVVHSVGGWCALMGAIITGPRLGFFDEEGRISNWETTGVHFSALGVLLMWIGWWGFNGGSTLHVGGNIGFIIINTNIAAASGGLGAILSYQCFARRTKMSYVFLNGILGGLVAITASCFMVTPFAAAAIGLIAGWITVWGTYFLLDRKIDDTVGAVPVHLFCGIWGTLCVALFGKETVIAQFAGHRLSQLAVQIAGIIVVGIWCVLVSGIVFLILKKFLGLRVSPQQEIYGYDIAGVYPIQPEEPAISIAEVQALFADEEQSGRQGE